MQNTKHNKAYKNTKLDANVNKLTHKSQNKTAPKQRKEHTYIYRHTINNKTILNIHNYT